MNIELKKTLWVRLKFLQINFGAKPDSRNNFKIGSESSMPIEIIHSYAILKKAAAITNYECDILSKEKWN